MAPISCSRSIFAFLILLNLGNLAAEQTTPFQALTRAVGDRLIPVEKLAPNLMDCSQVSVAELERREGASSMQWIYNGMYKWGEIPLGVTPMGGGTCIYLKSPEHRGLTREEGQVLLSASRLPFPVTANSDHDAREKAYSDRMRALEDFGGTESDDIGTINGFGYQIHFMALGTEFATLDRAQHEFANQKKYALARIKNSGGAFAGGNSIALDLKFSSAGKTRMLALMVVDGSLTVSDGTSEPIHTEWILHIPSGKFVFFDEMFANPQQARAHFSAMVSRVPDPMYVFLGDEHAQRDFETAYADAISRATTPTPEHFRHIGISSDPDDPFVGITFEYRRILPSLAEFPQIMLRSSGFRDLLKPEFRDAFSTAQ